MAGYELPRELRKIGVELSAALNYADELLAGNYEERTGDDMTRDEWTLEVRTQLRSAADRLYGLAAEAETAAASLRTEPGRGALPRDREIALRHARQGRPT